MSDDLRILSLFSGAGMLDRGIHGALQRLGFSPRTVLYCECDPGAQRILSARCEDQRLHDAPVWPDVRTLPGHRLRGRIDAVVGGFPCQDISFAGAGAGVGQGTRSGLFFDLLRTATDCGASLIFLENVAAIDSAASHVPPSEEEDPYRNEGAEIEERIAAMVIGAMADAGFHAAWVPLSASDVGAPHGRARWWCIGWRVANPPGQ